MRTPTLGLNPVFPTDNDFTFLCWWWYWYGTIPQYQCCTEAIDALLLPVEGIWNMVEVLKPNKRTTSVWSVKIAFIAVCVLLVASSYSSLQSFDYEAALRSGLVQWQSNISAAIFTSNEDNLLQEFQTINDRLLGPDEYGTGGCPPGCGCPIRPFADCPRHYTIQDVQISSSLGTSTAIRQTSREKVRIIQQQAQALCQQATDHRKKTDTGGYCLGRRPVRFEIPLPPQANNNSSIIRVPRGHAEPSASICATLADLFRAEHVGSLTDLGAGVGQYGSCLLQALPHLKYHGYDGAGDIEEYTHGFVEFTDLTVPLELSVSDWVLSLETGEHIPSKFEGIVMRNLHRHNCRGMILSWAIINGQFGGENHINAHSNQYLIGVLDQLGYDHDIELSNKLRHDPGDQGWFRKSIMAFRRRQPVC